MPLRDDPWNGIQPAALPESRGSEQKATNAPRMQTLAFDNDHRKFFSSFHLELFL
jgi:hypothetical protein